MARYNDKSFWDYIAGFAEYAYEARDMGAKLVVPGISELLAFQSYVKYGMCLNGFRPGVCIKYLEWIEEHKHAGIPTSASCGQA